MGALLTTRDDFRRLWTYSVAEELVNPTTRETATWERGYPKCWNKEQGRRGLVAELRASDRRGQQQQQQQQVKSVDVVGDGNLVAVGYVGGVEVLRVGERDGDDDDDDDDGGDGDGGRGVVFERVEWLQGPGEDREGREVRRVHWAPVMESDAGGAGDDTDDAVAAAAAGRENEVQYTLLVLTASQAGETDPKITLWSLNRAGRQLSFHVVINARLSSWSSQHGSSPFSPADRRTFAYLSGPRSADGHMTPLQSVIGRLPTHDVVRILPPANDRVIWQAFSPDGTMLATASWDQYVRVYGVESGELKYQFGPSGGQMWTGAWSGDGKMLAVGRGSPTTEIYVWNVTEGEQITTLRAGSSVGSKVQMASGGNNLLDLQRAQIADPKPAVQLPAGSGGGGGGGGSNNDHPSSSANNNPFTGLVSHYPPRTRLISTSRVFSHPRNSGWSRSMSFSPDGKSLAAGGREGHLFIIDPFTGEKFTSWVIGIPSVATDHSDADRRRIERLRRWIELRSVQWLQVDDDDNNNGRRTTTELIWRDGADSGVESWNLATNKRKRWGVETLRDIDDGDYSGWDHGHDLVVLVLREQRKRKTKRRLLFCPDGDCCVRVWDMDA